MKASSKNQASPATPDKSPAFAEKAAAELLEIGREQGYVTYAEILRLFPSEDASAEDLKGIISFLNENDVEIVQGAVEEEEAEATEEVDPDTFFSDDDDWVLEAADDEQEQKEPEPEPTPVYEHRPESPHHC